MLTRKECQHCAVVIRDFYLWNWMPLGHLFYNRLIVLFTILFLLLLRLFLFTAYLHFPLCL